MIALILIVLGYASLVYAAGPVGLVLGAVHIGVMVLAASLRRRPTRVQTDPK